MVELFMGCDGFEFWKIASLNLNLNLNLNLSRN